jgi:molybdopterin synthase catalytic subunit
MLQLTQQPIDPLLAMNAVRSPEAGAVAIFLGTVRQQSAGRTTVALEYECHPALAEIKLAELVGEARRCWPLCGCVVIHRTGRVPAGEIAVAIAASAPHRAEAFAAVQWLIDQIKQIVPIWKKEILADGSCTWSQSEYTPAADATPGE